MQEALWALSELSRTEGQEPAQAPGKVPYPADWSAADIAKDKRLQRVYGIDLDTWWDIWEAQDGKCGVCGRDLSVDTANVDHDHVGRFVRGLLCPFDNRYKVGRHRWPDIEKVYNYLKDPPALQVGEFKIPVRKRGRRKTSRIRRK